MDETNKICKTKFILDEISKIENYFIDEINETKSRCKILSKYVTIFNHIDKVLIILSATSGGVPIISFSTVIGASAGIASTSLTLIFSLTIGIVKKLLRYNKKEKEEA